MSEEIPGKSTQEAARDPIIQRKEKKNKVGRIKKGKGKGDKGEGKEEEPRSSEGRKVLSPSRRGKWDWETASKTRTITFKSFFTCLTAT